MCQELYVTVMAIYLAYVCQSTIVGPLTSGLSLEQNAFSPEECNIRPREQVIFNCREVYWLAVISRQIQVLERRSQRQNIHAMNFEGLSGIIKTPSSAQIATNGHTPNVYV